jgi:transposase-like protein
MRKIRQYDATFRREAVRLVAKNGNHRAVAESLGMPSITLWNWYNQDVRKKKSTGSRLSKAKTRVEIPKAEETLEEENVRLKRELAVKDRKIEQLEMDQAILKKAAAFFAKEST